ncbi:uridylate-specific endoribonuclease isoform X2 [Ambystoma mexicanum]|uniref:uridylate-specific endoribonuclease isoform X2 n=1 Tax=Ambystoma mexicanum TaxID=8296 RepID=UPI0037E90881
MKACLLLAVLLGCSCSWAFDSCSSSNSDPNPESFDFKHVDAPVKSSCQGRCGEAYRKKDPCHCNSKCVQHDNCCEDYSTVCKGAEINSAHGQDPVKSSCQGRCGEAYRKKDPCHCNSKCVQHDNCCEDYSTVCKGAEINSAQGQDPVKSSCQGRCGEAYRKKDPCHCNSKCVQHDNCCEDYSTVCKGAEINSAQGQDPAASDPSSQGRISQQEIEAVSESLYQADRNKAKEGDIILNKQHLVSKSAGKQDLCDEPFYTHVNAELLSQPTYACIISLFDNYDRKTGTSEEVDKSEMQEQDSFLQEIMKTDVMQKLYTFLHKKNLYATQEEFIADLKNMWFGLYSRGAGELDSSGFEHVFLGEVKKGKVSGFHSWIRFYLLEKKGMVDYYSHNYDGPWTSFPDVIGKQFDWDGFQKEVGSSFIGSSPEFDFAMYTLCFIARPGKVCTVSLGGHPLKIQTYTWTKSTYGDSKKYIATAYPVT